MGRWRVARVRSCTGRDDACLDKPIGRPVTVCRRQRRPRKARGSRDRALRCGHGWWDRCETPQRGCLALGRRAARAWAREIHELHREGCLGPLSLDCFCGCRPFVPSSTHARSRQAPTALDPTGPTAVAGPTGRASCSVASSRRHHGTATYRREHTRRARPASGELGNSVLATVAVRAALRGRCAAVRVGRRARF